ncbi:MAG TPA: hypothetical protein VM689_13305 [Aliidongia sp.]|nr:hypothetical protein [Aliidongia sp.]
MSPTTKAHARSLIIRYGVDAPVLAELAILTARSAGMKAIADEWLMTLTAINEFKETAAARIPPSAIEFSDQE